MARVDLVCDTRVATFVPDWSLSVPPLTISNRPPSTPQDERRSDSIGGKGASSYGSR